MNISLAILEDNHLHYEKISSLINSWATNRGHLVQIHWFQTGFDIINSEIIKYCQLLFSDIELSEFESDNKNDFSNGIEICAALRKKGFSGEIIFLTAFREYVFDGYNVQAMNYLLKPISEEAIMICLDKFISLHFSDYYYFHKNDEIIQIPFNDIVSISRSGHDCMIQTQLEVYVERTSLKNFENRLPKQFIRCHKSCIVNLCHIVSLSGYTIRLSNKTTQTAGRLYINDIRKELIRLSNENFI